MVHIEVKVNGHNTKIFNSFNTIKTYLNKLNTENQAVKSLIKRDLQTKNNKARKITTIINNYLKNNSIRPKKIDNRLKHLTLVNISNNLREKLKNPKNQNARGNLNRYTVRLHGLKEMLRALSQNLKRNNVSLETKQKVINRIATNFESSKNIPAPEFQRVIAAILRHSSSFRNSPRSP